MEIIAAGRLETPEEGFGLQQAILEDVGAGRRPPTALLWSSGPFVAATRPETRREGFAAAVKAASALGFPTLVRNSGGGAVAANEGTLSFSITYAVEDLRSGLYERYAELSSLIVGALRRLGIAAETGEVEGAFCPGEYSVRVGGPGGTKVAGLAQRVTRHAARVEALILVERTRELVPVLEAFYGALGLPFRPGSIGDLPVGAAEVSRALVREVERRYGALRSPLEEELAHRARSLVGTWSPAALS